MLPGIVRLAVVDSHPIQYHYPYFKLLAAAPEIDLHVYFCEDTRSGVHDPSYGRIKWDVPVLEGYASTFLWNAMPKVGARVT